jgi:hypothetical protein
MNESLNCVFLKQVNTNWNVLKRELLGEIEPTETSINDWQHQILCQHVWQMLDEMQGQAFSRQKGKIAGYEQNFFRQHQQIHAQIKRLVDQVNIEMNL